MRFELVSRRREPPPARVSSIARRSELRGARGHPVKSETHCILWQRNTMSCTPPRMRGRNSPSPCSVLPHAAYSDEKLLHNHELRASRQKLFVRWRFLAALARQSSELHGVACRAHGQCVSHVMHTTLMRLRWHACERRVVSVHQKAAELVWARRAARSFLHRLWAETREKADSRMDAELFQWAMLCSTRFSDGQRVSDVRARAIGACSLWSGAHDLRVAFDHWRWRCELPSVSSPVYGFR